MSTFKGKGDLVQCAESFPRGYKLMGLYVECPRVFGKMPSSSFAHFVQVLAVHDNMVAQTFFRSFWILLDKLIPPPLIEIVLKPSEFDSEEEDSKVPQEASKKQKPTGIVFRPVDSLPPPSTSSIISTPLVNPPPPP